jgi:hypothetical protein
MIHDRTSLYRSSFRATPANANHCANTKSSTLSHLHNPPLSGHLLDGCFPCPTGKRPQLVRTAGLEPALSCKKQIFIPLRLSPPPLGVRGLDCPFTMAISGVRCHPSSLYTFPQPGAWLGIGLGRLSPLAFPDFERFYSADFPAGTPIKVCCVYRFRHVRTSGFVPHHAHSCNCGVYPTSSSWSLYGHWPMSAQGAPCRRHPVNILLFNSIISSALNCRVAQKGV